MLGSIAETRDLVVAECGRSAACTLDATEPGSSTRVGNGEKRGMYVSDEGGMPAYSSPLRGESHSIRGLMAGVGVAG